jgi:Mrp family chromosome partitioning ATPase
VLASERTGDVLAELAENYEMVLIDTPPLLAVSDAVPLIGQVDAVVLVVRLGMATQREIEDVVETIRRVPKANLLGVALNCAPGRRGGAGYYGGY